VAVRDDPSLQWLDLSDFTPGIDSAHHSLTRESPSKDGSATVEGTWSCYGLPGGGLAPLPRISTASDCDNEGGPPAPDIPANTWDYPTTADGYPADYASRIAVLDAHVVAPVERVPDLATAVSTTRPSIDLFTVRQWYLVDDANHVNVLWRFRNHPVYSGDAGNPYAFKDLITSDYDATLDIHPSRWKYGWGSIMETRTQFASATDADRARVGPPVIVAGMGGVIKYGDLGTSDEGDEVSAYYSFPDYHTGITTDPTDRHADLHDAVYAIPQPLSVAIPGQVFGHQGRLCAVTRKSGWLVTRRDNFHGNHDGFRSSAEVIDYWPVNGIYNAPDGPTRAVFLEENSTGYGVVHSVNANSLLLVKNRGGAVQVSGDLDNPAVQRLPGVPSVGGLANRGAMTDKGFAYGTVSGVWMWTGSDTATNLAPQLDPLFWVPDDPTIPRRELEQLRGSFTYSFPWLYAPNNWVMDMRTGGWFRYHPTPTQDATDGTIFAFNECDHEGNLWAVVPSYVLNTRFFCLFDQTTAVASYQWESQPLNKVKARVGKVRSVAICASGQGRVTVTLTGLDGPGTPHAFDIGGDDIDLYAAADGVDFTDLTVKINVEATDPALPAPTVHSVRLGYDADTRGVTDMGAR